MRDLEAEINQKIIDNWPGCGLLRGFIGGQWVRCTSHETLCKKCRTRLDNMRAFSRSVECTKKIFEPPNYRVN